MIMMIIIIIIIVIITVVVIIIIIIIIIIIKIKIYYLSKFYCSSRRKSFYIADQNQISFSLNL